jgi:hypothetical protein
MSFVTQTAYAQYEYISDKTRKSALRAGSKEEKRVRTEPFIRTELYFGRSSPDGEINEEDFAVFLEEIVTREFPEGLTVLNGIGQFKDASGTIVQEKTKVLILLYQFETRRTVGRKIELIRNEYKKRFQQQSVLRVDSTLPVRVSF